MTSINLPFTPEKTISVPLPPTVQGHLFAPRQVQPRDEVDVMIQSALQTPLGSRSIKESVRADDSILIICDDVTRPTPTDVILPFLINQLNQAGVPDQKIDIVFALGTHRPMSDVEMRKKVGEIIFSRIACHNHNAFDKRELEYYGVSREGIPVWLNYRLKMADFVIGIGDIVPHPIAGFSAGAKILYPGVAGEETIAGFHVSFGLDPENHYGSFSAPARKSIHELAGVAGLDFLINTVITSDNKIADVFAGNYVDVYEKGILIAQQVYGVPTNKLFDIVIASSYPAWLEFWQGGKGIYSAVTLAKPGAEIIIVTACPEGIAMTHPDFGPSVGASPSDVVNGLRENSFADAIGAAIAVKLSRLRERYQISLVSQGLTEQDANIMGLGWYPGISSALETALVNKGYPDEIGVIPYGGHTYCFIP